MWLVSGYEMGMHDDKLFRSQMMVADYLRDRLIFPFTTFTPIPEIISKAFSLSVAFWYFVLIWLSFNHPGIASDGLKGRVFEVSLADLQNDEVAFRKFKLITEDVQGKNCLTNFHGMDLTRDKMCSMVKKWQVIMIFQYKSVLMCFWKDLTMVSVFAISLGSRAKSTRSKIQLIWI